MIFPTQSLSLNLHTINNYSLCDVRDLNSIRERVKTFPNEIILLLVCSSIINNTVIHAIYQTPDWWWSGGQCNVTYTKRSVFLLLLITIFSSVRVSVSWENLSLIYLPSVDDKKITYRCSHIAWCWRRMRWRCSASSAHLFACGEIIYMTDQNGHAPVLVVGNCCTARGRSSIAIENQFVMIYAHACSSHRRLNDCQKESNWIYLTNGTRKREEWQ